MGDERTKPWSGKPRDAPRATGARAACASGSPPVSPESKLEGILYDVARCPTVMSPLAPRSAFGGTSRFHVLRRLGSGGFGVVYLVRDVAADAESALKTLPGAGPELLYRLKREFRTLADLRHENLVTFYELFAEEDCCFFTMEYVPGRTFLDHVRRDGVVDTRRLRASLSQVARGLSALHEVGKLHRDVKPSNVLVSQDERVVILDFGLATEIEESGHGRSAVMAGTPGYMSPEHALGQPVSAASDWFSVGVMVYEALTGQLPFAVPERGVPVHASGDPPSFEGISPGVPPEIVELCRGLLSRDPARRPGAPDIAAVTGRAAVAERHAGSPRDPPLIGRVEELGELRRALRGVQEGRGVTVLVEGSSGVGKTALVQHFLAQAERVDDAVVLRGRCYERERVPYQGIDSLVDDLCRLLRHGGSKAEALLPRQLPALVRLFPVLERVPSVARQCRSARGGEPGEQELRQRAFGALRELFGRISDRFPLVLHIDDLQWGDLDTAALLQEILHPPDAPSMLLVLSYREEDRARSRCVQALLQASIGDVARIEVAPLKGDAAAQLARTCLSPDESGIDPASLAAEAGGNPLFILELARFAALHGARADGTGALDLQGALRARIEQLPEMARRLLEVVAVAGHPIAEMVARRAADVSGPPWESWGRLVGGHLVRFSGALDERHVEPLHDRIREIVADSLAPSRILACHRGLAAALEEAGGADPEVLARHHEAAGDLPRARAMALVAAAQAEQALAFDRAARLFRWALHLAPEAGDADKVLASLAAALAHAGMGVDAADAYERAAERAAPDARTRLRREAALQLLISGHIDRGLDVATETLRAAGLAIPRTPRSALASLLARMAFLRVRGLGFRERAEKDVPALQLERMDHLWALSCGLAIVDEVRGADFASRHLLLALRAGEPFRVARGLAVMQAHAAVAAPRSRRAATLCQAVDRLDAKLGDPLVHAYAQIAKAIHAQSCGAWSTALDLADTAERALIDKCTGVDWEIWTARAFANSSLFYLGRWRELSRRAGAQFAQACDRGNVYGMVAARAPYGILAWLAGGDVAGARRQLGEALASWSFQGFHIQHYWLLMAESYADLCAGDGVAAWARVSERWRDLETSLLLRIPFVRTELLHARGACAVAAALGERADRLRRDLLREAAKTSSALERIRSPMARALARLLRAAIEEQGGRRDASVRLLRLAVRELDAQDMFAHASAARARLFALGAGEPSPLLPDEDLADPAGLVRMLVPGFAG